MKTASQKLRTPLITDRVLEGSFKFDNGKLDFKCHTKNVDFVEVLQAITALRDECQRQIDNQSQCPFHKKH